MSAVTLVACAALVLVALLVSLPVLYETTVSIIAATCLPTIRERSFILKTAKVVDRFAESRFNIWLKMIGSVIEQSMAL